MKSYSNLTTSEEKYCINLIKLNKLHDIKIQKKRKKNAFRTMHFYLIILLVSVNYINTLAFTFPK